MIQIQAYPQISKQYVVFYCHRILNAHERCTKWDTWSVRKIPLKIQLESAILIKCALILALDLAFNGNKN